MNLLKSPEESLTHYFDELLCETVWESAPVEQKLETQIKSIDTVDEATAYVETIKKQRLEKLLQSAQRRAFIKPLSSEPVKKIVEEAKGDSQISPQLPISKKDDPATLINSPSQSHVESAAVLRSQDSIVISRNDSISSLASKPLKSDFELKDEFGWMANGRPEWAQERFDVLLFTVSGLQLAVPLIALGQIQPLTEELTPLFGQADWFMGLQPTPQGQIRTVNTAKFVMPERYDERFLETAKYVVSINGVPWGLAVDAVHQPISLNPDDVRWRTDRSKRVWLAGTVKEHMCALLDIPRMGQLLQSTDKNSKA